jgi:hypothetical protein
VDAGLDAPKQHSTRNQVLLEMKHGPESSPDSI